MEVAVEVKGLTKVYDDEVKALDGVDLNVEAGKVFALLGPNGAGKTTLMRIFDGMVRRDYARSSGFQILAVKFQNSVPCVFSGVWSVACSGVVEECVRSPWIDFDVKYFALVQAA